MTATQTFSAAEQALMADAARRVVAARMAVPAMMFLETLAPMNLVTASMLHALQPLLGIMLPADKLSAVATLLERREAIPAFVAAIDVAEDARRRGLPPP
jgi:hypothetical protein